MKLEQQVTSLEISKRLKELGVKQESFFRWQVWKDRETGRQKKMIVQQGEYNYGDIYSAFTVAELGDMLLTDITIKKRTYWLNTARMSHGWSVGYVSRKGDYYLMNEHESVEVTEADARGKMLIYLLENKLI